MIIQGNHLEMKCVQIAFDELRRDVNLYTDKLHWSFISKRGKILSYGRNCKKTHPLAKRYGYRYEAMHSELDAFLKLPKRIDFSELTMTNVRLSIRSLRCGFPILRMAKPCQCCMGWTSIFKEIVFSTENGNFIKV